MKSTSRMIKGIFTILFGLTVVACASDTFAQGTWETKASGPTFRRAEAGAAVNGILYAVGGADPFSTSSVGTVEAYDPATDTWTTKASLPVASQQLKAGVINGILYAVGGGTCCGALATLQAYDPATNSWSIKTSMPTPRYSPAAGVVNGILYVVGGVGLATEPCTQPSRHITRLPTPGRQRRRCQPPGTASGSGWSTAFSTRSEAMISSARWRRSRPTTP